LQIADIRREQPDIGLQGIEKVCSVRMEGIDITKECRVTTENLLVIPLKPGRGVSLYVEAHVTPEWWEKRVEKHMGHTARK
jgi:hypothetical protein